LCGTGHVTQATGWCGTGQMCFASVLRFCTMAARWNSSRAVAGADADRSLSAGAALQDVAGDDGLRDLISAALPAARARRPTRAMSRHRTRFQCITDGYRLTRKSLEGGDATAGDHRGTRSAFRFVGCAARVSFFCVWRSVRAGASTHETIRLSYDWCSWQHEPHFYCLQRLPSYHVDGNWLHRRPSCRACDLHAERTAQHMWRDGYGAGW
jgi:hypothetical protein